MYATGDGFSGDGSPHARVYATGQPVSGSAQTMQTFSDVLVNRLRNATEQQTAEAVQFSQNAASYDLIDAMRGLVRASQDYEYTVSITRPVHLFMPTHM